MKVKELKEFLETLDQEGEVWLVNSVNCGEKLDQSFLGVKSPISYYQAYDKPVRKELGGGNYTVVGGEWKMHTPAELVIFGE